jgi:hypothetical protein
VVRIILISAALLSAAAHAGDAAYALIGFTVQGDSEMPGLGSGASVAAEEYFATAALPVYTGDSRSVSLGLDYQYMHFDYRGVPSRNRDLHRLQFPVSFVFHDNALEIDGYIAPGIATSSNIFKDFMKRGSSDDWYLSGAVEIRHGKDARQWIAGLAYDRFFGRDRLYPVLGVGMMVKSDLVLRLAYPVSGVEWRKSDRGTLAAHVYPAGFAWRVVHDDFASEFDYRVEGIRSQVQWRYRIYRQLHLDLHVAYETNRRHEFASDRSERLESTADDEWLVGFGLGIGAARPRSAHGARSGLRLNRRSSSR